MAPGVSYRVKAGIRPAWSVSASCTPGRTRHPRSMQTACSRHCSIRNGRNSSPFPLRTGRSAADLLHRRRSHLTHPQRGFPFRRWHKNLPIPIPDGFVSTTTWLPVAGHRSKVSPANARPQKNPGPVRSEAELNNMVLQSTP